MKLSKDVAIDRLLNRLTCSNCGFITKKSDKKSDVCPQCGGKLVSRSDDTIEGIHHRFQVYDLETFPLIDRYKKRGVLVEIDANRNPDEVLSDVLKVIK